MDIGGGGGNSAPTADFTHSCTDLDCSFTDQSSDSDGSIASWSWDFGDGATSSKQHPTHTYDCGGVYTVTLTVTDDDGATGDISQFVSVSDEDTDGDGLTDCEETDVYGTDPTEADSDNDGLDDGDEVNTYPTDPLDPDTDDDEFLDGEEVNNFGKPSIFCGSSCEYPDPTTPDVYLEVDTWEHDDAFGNPEQHAMSDSVRDDLIAEFSQKGIQAHIDNGQLGGGDDIISGDETTSWSDMEQNWEDNDQVFNPDRNEMFHHMIYVHSLTHDGDSVCGTAELPPVSSDPDGFADFSVIAHGEHTDDGLLEQDCIFGPADTVTAIRDTVLMELGHNDLGVIEPQSDQCDNSDDTEHDIYDSFAMSTGAENDQGNLCGDNENADYESNRWAEYLGPQDQPDPDVGSDDAPGDVNNGLK